MAKISTGVFPLPTSQAPTPNNTKPNGHSPCPCARRKTRVVPSSQLSTHTQSLPLTPSPQRPRHLMSTVVVLRVDRKRERPFLCGALPQMRVKTAGFGATRRSLPPPPVPHPPPPTRASGTAGWGHVVSNLFLPDGPPEACPQVTALRTSAPDFTVEPLNAWVQTPPDSALRAPPLPRPPGCRC